MDFSDIVADFLDSGIASSTDTCGDDIHIDHSSSWIDSALLHRSSDQTDSLLDITGFDFLT